MASSFELNLSLPTDTRFADTARELAIHAAKHAGVPDAKAHAFGDEVAVVVRQYLEDRSEAATVPLVVRQTTGPVEVLINGRTITPAP